MHLGRRSLVVVALPLLVTIPPPAPSARGCCGLGRWRNGPESRSLISAFPRVEDCHTALATLVEGMKQKHNTEGWVSTPTGAGSYQHPTQGRVQLNGLHDTIDPRGANVQ